ncbi:allophanate hydrolase [Brachybacterium ginsengisoli]|uniref:Allophanate hydrolase n=1 Tax=Brachybacterium ginsengisoli TaxID=1331682 RepID=A0A291GTK8_9MICO|nr:carboxyltransferase domain-containing protein [Brachybacterium ginsengisoli]ATG53549.1 allophanate hydrolase [Brachybacterium ginsengisoli]
MSEAPGRPARPARLDPPSAVHRAGESALLAQYPGTAEVLAAAAAVRELDPAHLIDLVPAERTLLLVGSAARDLPDFAALLRDLPASAGQAGAGDEVSIDVVYDGEDLAEVAELLGMSTGALISAHSGTLWTAAFGGFAPGFAYLLPEPAPGADGGADAGAAPVGTPWEVPRRAEPRTTVPAGAVGLASRYCGIYPRPSPGGWQLIGRSDAALFDADREPPALLTPGTRVRFTPQRASARIPVPAVGRRVRRRPAEPENSSPTTARPALEILSPGPLALLEDGGRPGRAASGVSRSGAFDQGAMLRADLAVGNPSGAAVLEALAGGLQLRALAPIVLAVSGARAPIALHRADEEGADRDLDPQASHELPLALDPGDLLEVGPVTDGLRLVLAVRGGLLGTSGTLPVLGSRSRDTLSALGPAALTAGDLLVVGPTTGLDAVPVPIPAREPPPAGDSSTATDPLEIPLHAGPRDALLGAPALDQLLATPWRVRPDSNRVGVRLDGEPLTVPSGSATLPSEPMVPGAIQVPPSGLPVVFGPDHPTTGGYPVIAVVTRTGLDRLAQAGAGTGLRFVLVP